MSFSTLNTRVYYSFIHEKPIWVDIPQLFKYIKTQPKGHTFAVLRDVLRCVDDDWVLTYHRNTGTDYMRLYYFLKHSNIANKMPKVDKDARNTKFKNSGCSRHARAQALDDIITFPAKISKVMETVGNAYTAVQKVTNVVNKVDQMFQRLNDMVNMVCQQMENTMNSVSANIKEIILYIIKIVSLAFLIQQDQNRSVTNVIALLTLIMPSSAMNCIQQVAVGLIRVIQRISGCNAHADDDEDNHGFVVAFFNLTVGIMKGLFGAVPKDVYDNLFISSKKVRLISDYIRGTTTIVDCLLKLWEKCVELIGDKILKYFNILPSFIKEDAIGPLVDEFLQIKQERIDITATTNQESARRIMLLYEKLMKTEASLVKRTHKDNTHFRILPYLRIMIKVLDNVIARIPDHMRTGLAPRRIKPFWVYIYGDPRIGKTGVFQPYIVNEISRALAINSKYEDYTNYTYLRNCGEEYWEGYDNHPVLWYNDIFQNFAEEPAMHKAIMELTNIVDDNVYPLEMAFERKHNVYFNSQLVISNAQNEMINMPFITNKCWSGGAHLYARRNVCVHFSINKKYASAVGIDFAAQQLEMDTNPANCVGYEFCTEFTPEEYKLKLLFPKDLYILTFTEPLTGNVISVQNFETGIKHICDTAIEYKTKQSDFKDRLYNHFQLRWAQGEEDDDFHDVRRMTEAEVAMVINVRSANAVREIDAIVRDLIGTEDVEMVRAVRTNEDFGVDVINTIYGGNTHSTEDMFVRATFLIETVGVDHFVRKNFSWWHRLKLRFHTLLDNIRAKWRDIMANVFNHPHLKIFIQFITFIISAYSYYKLLNWYYEWIGTLSCFKPIIINPEQQRQALEEQIKVLDAKAQTAEGKQIPKRPQVLRVKRTKDGPVAMSYDQQNSIVENIISKQMCKFAIVVKHDGEEVHMRIFGSGLCLGSDVFVIPYHFWFRFKEMQAYWESHGDTVTLRLMWNDKLKVDIEWDTITTCRLDYKHCEDLIYMRINKLVQKSHIKQFFVRSDDRPTLYELYMYGMRAGTFTLNVVQVQNGEYVDTVYNHESRDDPLYGGKFEKREVVIPICLKYYNCASTVGDCGMMVMNCDSKMNNRKIMAMHTAGHVGESYGLGSLIFYEDIEEAFQTLYADEKPIVMPALAYEDSAEYAQPLVEMGLNVLGKLPRLVVPQYNVDRYPTLMLPRKSKISHSIVHDMMNEDFGPTTLGVAKLRPYNDEDGNRVFPILNAMKKIAVVSNSCKDSEMMIIQDHIAESIAKWRSPYEPRILTDDEMINGVGNLNAVEMKTSAGYPYVILDNSNGKLPFFEKCSDSPVKYKMGKYLQAKFEQRLHDAAEGIITETYFVDTLKDETREIPKVSAGKTRLFQIAPVDFNLMIRKYFGAFLMHVQSTFINGEGAVGINANSTEWTAMLKQQLTVGDSFINGDGRNFDASASQRIGMSNVESINKWYRLGSDWCEEHDMIRRVIFATFLNSKHIYRDVIYMALQGNKSGTAITTWFNNLIGMFVIRLAVLRAYDTLKDFNRGVGPKFYGDDDSISVNVNLYPKLTCRYYQQVMASVGIEYTSALKGDVIETWYAPPDISFLKRKFIYDGVKYLPQLDWQVIIEIARWSESDPTNMIDQLNRFNSSLLESSNYGRKVFTDLRAKYVSYCYLLNRAGYSISTNELFIYDYCEKIKWGEEYSPIQLQYDLAETSDKSEVVHSVGCGSPVQLSNFSDNADQHSEILQLIAQSQTYEGKSKPSRPQVIRINRPKAQGEETEEAQDFNAYLVIMDYLKDMRPCMESFSRALLRASRRPEVRWTFAVLHTKVMMMMKIYNECVELLTPNEPAIAQGEEAPTHGILPQREKFMAAGIMGSAQSVATTDETKDNVIEQHSKTTFVNTNAPHQPPVEHKSIPRMFNCNFSKNQEDYFNRPMAFSTFSWKSTDAIYSQVGQWVLPKDYYNDYIRAKGAMIAYARPNMEITITVNATRFHYGRLMFVVMPFALQSDAKGVISETLPEAYLKAQNASSWPHWYQLTAGPRQSVKFVVPYRHYLNQTALNKTDEHGWQLFGLRAYVMAPLLSANATVSPVEVTLFAAMINPEFAGNILSSAIAQGEEADLSMKGLTVNDPKGSLRSGFLTQTFDSVSAITRDAANFTHMVGMSTGVNLGSTGSMQIRQPLMNKCSDLPNSVILGPTLDAGLVPSGACVNSETDDMNITHVVSSPFLLSTYKLTSSIAANATIATIYLNPRMMVYSGEGYTPAVGTQFPSPMAYIARMFDFWRGSFKFHFSAICSGFHSVRLRIVYIPGNDTTNVATLPDNLWSASTLRNIVWDINDTSDITVEIPYETLTQWSRSNTDYLHDYSGSVYLQVINPLTSVTDTVSPIYIQTFVSGCDDFQFAKVAAYGSPYSPDIWEKAGAQGEERDPCAIPSSSSTCLREQPGIFMGDVDKRRRILKESTSNVYSSLKQLCNQLTFIDRFKSTTTDTNNITARYYTPYGKSYTARDYNDDFWLSYLHKCIALFRFMRGGFRIHVLCNDKVQATAYAHNMSTSVYQTPTDQDGEDFMNGKLDLKFTRYGCAYFYDNSVYPIDVTIPYYSLYPCFLTYQTYVSDDVAPMVGVVALSTQKAAKTMLFAVSGADDFMLGYRLSVPRCRFADRPKSSMRAQGDDHPYYVDVLGVQFHYNKTQDIFEPIKDKVDENMIKYSYLLLKGIGFVWVKQTSKSKYPAGIEVPILTRLTAFKPEVLEPKRQRRSFMEKLAEGQITDYTDSD